MVALAHRVMVIPTRAILTRTYLRDNIHPYRKYIKSLFWAALTLTTIGENESPETILEYVFTGCTFLIGVLLFATIVGNMGDVISSMNAARAEFQERMDGIKRYMEHHEIPEQLQDRVKRWLQYSWSRTKALEEEATLGFLPHRLRTEIAIHVHLETLKKVKISIQIPMTKKSYLTCYKC